MTALIRAMRPPCMILLAMTAICGVIYPAIVTGIAQAAFPHRADGSMIAVTHGDGTRRVYGSELIAQEFTKPEYMIGRPMGATNLSPVGEKEAERVAERVAWWRAFDPENDELLPVDLVTASGSGVDPHISPEAAEFQVARIAKARGVSEAIVREAIRRNSDGRLFGFWGEPRVNVLKVNLTLDGII